MEEGAIVYYLNRAGMPVSHSGNWFQVNAGIVLNHSAYSQTFIPWGRVLTIEQTLSPSTGYDPHEFHNKRLSNRLRSN